MNIIEIILNALKLIIKGDTLLYEVIFLSLKVSLFALIISHHLLAILTRFFFSLKKFLF